MIGDPARLVRRVAIVCGAGGEMMTDALWAGAEVFLTGEMRFHDYLTAQAQGLALLLPGHYATELRRRGAGAAACSNNGPMCACGRAEAKAIRRNGCNGPAI